MVSGRSQYMPRELEEIKLNVSVTGHIIDKLGNVREYSGGKGDVLKIPGEDAVRMHKRGYAVMTNPPPDEKEGK